MAEPNNSGLFAASPVQAPKPAPTSEQPASTALATASGVALAGAGALVLSAKDNAASADDTAEKSASAIAKADPGLIDDLEAALAKDDPAPADPAPEITGDQEMMEDKNKTEDEMQRLLKELAAGN